LNENAEDDIEERGRTDEASLKRAFAVSTESTDGEPPSKGKNRSSALYLALENELLW